MLLVIDKTRLIKYLSNVTGNGTSTLKNYTTYSRFHSTITHVTFCNKNKRSMRSPIQILHTIVKLVNNNDRHINKNKT